VLPSSVYVIIAEKLHPHVPKVADLREAGRSLSSDERRMVLARARALGAHAKAIEEAFAGE
jgi:hypothetical protein